MIRRKLHEQILNTLTHTHPQRKRKKRLIAVFTQINWYGTCLEIILMLYIYAVVERYGQLDNSQLRSQNCET
jgi:hypothetical protein